MSVNRIDIVKGIKGLNLNSDVVCLHSSLKSFGFVEGGAATIIDAFLEQGYTILTPAFTYDYAILPPKEDRPSRNGCDYDDYREGSSDQEKIFTVESKAISKESLGALPYEVLQRPERKRGYNPINSFSSIGPQAESLISEQTSQDVYSPLEKLYHMDGYIIMMGVGLTSMTAIHYAEQRSGRNLFIRWANDLDGRPIRVSIGSCSRGYDIFDPILERIEKRIRVGKSVWRVFPMRETIDICTKAIKENQMITHCNYENCERCRDGVQGGPILN